MNKLSFLIQTLADGNYHSGEKLGGELGVTRAAVWKLIKTINEEWGVHIESSTKKGYRIPDGIELLDKKKILGSLQAEHKKILQKCEIFDELPSTNDYLMQTVKDKATHGHVCLAERQTAGKGRRGRVWLSPFGTNIYLSLLWQFSNDLSKLAGLSLVVALAVIKALEQYGVREGLVLKWPNDVLWHGKKLAGILIETRGESNEHLTAVIGIGLNVKMPKMIGENISQPWADLSQIVNGIIHRNQLAGLLLDHLCSVITQFNREGIKPFIKQWREYDITLDKKVSLQTSTEKFSGIARGIDETGCILVENAAGKIEHFSIGEISLRLG